MPAAWYNVMAEQTLLINNESDTMRLGALLAQSLPAGAVVSLVGTLGAGKTRLVQAVAEALGVEGGRVTSPTFVLLNEYTAGRMPVYHFDAYRLKDEDEFLQLGPEEYFNGSAAAGPGITFVEWGDRVADCMPRICLKLDIAVTGNTQRLVTANDPSGWLPTPLRLGN